MWKFKLQFYVILLVKNLILLLPENSRFKLAENLGRLAFKYVKRRRFTAIENVRVAFPDKREEELEEIALNSFIIMSKAFISSLWFDEYLSSDKVKFHNEEVFHNLMKEKKGLVVALMHLGNMETPLKLGEHYPIITVARKQKNPYIDDMITKLRTSRNVTLLKKSNSTSTELIKLIEPGKMIGLFSDHRDDGAKVTFFGRETTAPTGAVFLALKYNIPMILVYSTLNPDNTSTIYATEEIKLERTGKFKNDVLTNSQLLINEMEKVIKKHPDQWMWFHDRFSIYRSMRNNKK